jgi:hypothetical protein
MVFACLPGAIIDKTQNQQVAGYIRQFGFYPVDKAYLSTVQVDQPNQVRAVLQKNQGLNSTLQESGTTGWV